MAPSSRVGHDSFADLLPVVRAASFTPRPYTPVPKPLLPVTNSATRVPAPMMPGSKPLQVTGANGVTRTKPTAFNTKGDTVLNQITSMNSFMRGYENEGRAIQPPTNGTGRLNQDRIYREQVPKASQTSQHQESTYNENIMAPQPRPGKNDISEDKLRQLDNLQAEFKALNDDASPPLLAREGPIEYSSSPHSTWTRPANRAANGVTGVLRGGFMDDSLRDFPNGSPNDNGCNGHSHDLTVARAETPCNHHSVASMPASPKEDKEPIVRLTQGVYNALSAAIKASSREKAQFLKDKDMSQREIAKLQQETQDLRQGVNRLAEARAVNGEAGSHEVIHDLQAQIESLQQEITKLSSQENDQIQQLRDQVETYRSQQSTVGDNLKQKEHELRKLTSDMQTLHTHTRDGNQQRDARLKGLAELITQRDQEIAELKSSLAAQQAARLNDPNEERVKEMADQILAKRETFAINEQNADKWATRVQNLNDTLATREKLYSDQQQKIDSLNTQNAEYIKQLKNMHKSAHSQKTIDTLNETIRAKTQEASRLTNDLRDMTKRFELSQATIKRVSDNGKALRGAAHLVAARQGEKLQTTVFGCVTCYVKNQTCDNGAKCQPCISGDETCFRWRCSLVHRGIKCPPDRPCGMVHGHDGWLMTKEPRPQW